MGAEDARRFVDRFTKVWANPEPEEFADLWADGGVLLHPTMERAIPKTEIPEYVRRLKAIVPDVTLRPKRWAASGDEVFIEWTLSMTPPDRGEGLSWDGVDRFTLEGARAIEGIAYFDTAPIWARLDPSADRGELLDAAARRAESLA